jgi:hypothetical protein
MLRPISSALLLGILLASAPLMAQPDAAPKAAQGVLEVAVTYNATLSDAAGGNSFWMQGGSVEIAGDFYRGLGATADISGSHVGNINSSGVGLDLVTATFGPRYTWHPTSKRYELFGQGLVGEANGLNSIFPRATGETETANSLALEAGGGMNVALSPHVALRAFEVNWLRTQLPNSTTNVQNNIRLGAGIVFKFR